MGARQAYRAFRLILIQILWIKQLMGQYGVYWQNDQVSLNNRSAVHSYVSCCVITHLWVLLRLVISFLLLQHANKQRKT